MEHAAGHTAASTGMTAADREALDALQWHWGDAYEIGRDDDRGWWAQRGDRRGQDLKAATPDELLAEITADYALRPVPRPDPAADDDER